MSGKKQVIAYLLVISILIVGGLYFFRVGGKSRSPVYLIVLDEMSTEVLLDEDKGLNEDQFPNFKKLSLDADWYRNATSVAVETQFGVPAILTGRYPPLKDVRMTYDNYPVNICTILWKVGYTVNAYESSTTLCDRSAGAKVSYQPRLLAKINSYIENRFSDKNRERPEDFLDWVSESDGSANNFNVIHSTLPHFPYQYTSSGEKYADSDYFDFKTSDVNGVWENEQLAATAYQQYFWQSKYVDLLLGELIKKLKSEGSYEEAVIIVTADHGATYRLGANRRWPILNDQNTWDNKSAVIDMVKVPLFVKMPGKTGGRVINERVSTVDILPTLLNYLNVNSNVDFDGRDLLTESTENNGLYVLLGRTHFNRNELTKREHDLDILDEEYDPQEIKSRHDVGRSWMVRTTRDDVIGKKVDELTVLDVDVEVNVSEVPMITGKVNGIEDERNLALGVVVNGIVEVVTYTYDKDEEKKFIGMLQEGAVGSEDDVEVIVLDWVE